MGVSPWISPLGSLLGIGGSSAKTDRKYELQSMGLLTNLANLTSTQGTSNLATGSKDLTSIMNQLLKITGGGQGALEQVAPQVNTIASQYQAGRRAAAEYSPRGGGRTSALSDTGFAEMGDVQKMLFGAQEKARGQAGSLGEALANLGLGETETAVAASGDAADIALKHGTAQSATDASIGQGLGGLLAMMLMK